MTARARSSRLLLCCLVSAGLWGVRARAYGQSAIAIAGGDATLALRVVNTSQGPVAFRTALQVGGVVDLATQRLPSGCIGHVPRKPHYIVRFQRGAVHLRVFATSSADTTLVVNAPDGRWHCSDDWNGHQNPMVEIPNGPSGQYDIWVGARLPGAPSPAVLYVTESLVAHP